MNLPPTPNKICWKCQKKVNPEWTFCPFCATRQHDTCDPFPPQAERDIKFLNDLYSFGWYNRDLAAIVLYESITMIEHYYSKGREDKFKPIIEAGRAQKILRLKIFAEYIALLEAFGYLCIAIRERKATSMIWTFLNSEPKDVMQFYNQVLVDYPKLPTLAKLLKFPSPSRVKKAAESYSDVNLPELEKVGHADGIYTQLIQNIRICAEQYRENSGVTVRIYNKIKHVFTIIEGEDWINPPPDVAHAAILVDILNGVAQTTFFSMSQEKADQEMANIRIVTEMGAELLAICIGFQKLGILL